MSLPDHAAYQELVSLAAAGGLDASQERELRRHLDRCSACSLEMEEWQTLASALSRTPTPQPPPALIERVRRLVELEQASRSDDSLTQTLFVFLIFFSWTITLVTWGIVRLISGEALSWASLLSIEGMTWPAAYFGLAWLGGGAAAVLLGQYYRRTRTRRIA